MKTIIITGSAGLIGSESVKFFCKKGYNVIGIDNDMRRYFFGEEASTRWNVERLKDNYKNFTNYQTDIRDFAGIKRIFDLYQSDIDLIIHTAAQPSHDWAAREPFTDFNINANGTQNLLEATRLVSPNAVFIFTSTNKVYGDTPNRLPLVELDSRWEIQQSHPYYGRGIDETMSIDNSLHSIFGVSKLSADIMVQEYGKYFGMNTGVFRGGCLTGPAHSATELHGFLGYLMKCVVIGREYQIYGYKGKQVRDNIHSSDLVNAFWQFYNAPRQGEVYNMGGSRYSNCSILEAIPICEEITNNHLSTRYIDKNRIGDHIWWISDVSKFKQHYPDWTLTKNIRNILLEIFENNYSRWTQEQN